MLHSKDTGRYLAARNEAIERREAYVEEVRIIRHDGDISHVSIRGQPMFDDEGRVVGVFGTCQDISERKLTEQALVQSEQRFRDFSATAADMFWETGLDLRFTYVSEHVVDVTRNPTEFFIGQRRQDFAVDDIGDKVWQ